MRISKAIEQERAATQRLLDETKKQFVEFKIQPFQLTMENVHDFTVSQVPSNGLSNGHHRHSKHSIHSNQNGHRSPTTSPSKSRSTGLKRKRSEIADHESSEKEKVDGILNGSHPSKRRDSGKREDGEDDDDGDLEILSNGYSHTNSKEAVSTNTDIDTNTKVTTRERSKSVPNGHSGLTLPNLSDSFVAAKKGDDDNMAVHSASQPQMSALRTPIKKKRVLPRRSCRQHGKNTGQPSSLSQFVEMNGTHSPSASKKNAKQRYRSGTEMDVDHVVKRRRLNHV